jgi:hypothetical protein
MDGEARHEICRFGTLTEAFRIDATSGRQTPTVIPLCLWRLPDDCPPAVKRMWGGAIEFDRDCAVCRAFDPLGSGE